MRAGPQCNPNKPNMSTSTEKKERGKRGSVTRPAVPECRLCGQERGPGEHAATPAAPLSRPNRPNQIHPVDVYAYVRGGV